MVEELQPVLPHPEQALIDKLEELERRIMWLEERFEAMGLCCPSWD